MDKKYSVKDILHFLPKGYELRGNAEGSFFTNTQPVDSADALSLVFVNPQRKDKNELLAGTAASVVVCDPLVVIPEPMLSNRCFVIVDNPKLVYARILNTFFALPLDRSAGIHATAVISPDAVIHPSAKIGPFCIIGKCVIHENVFVKSHAVVHDNVVLSRDVVVHEYCNIGCEGFGFVQNEENAWEKMSHIGRTLIGEGVELFPYSNVDKGTLGDTVVGKGTKVDHYAHIGHNCRVGENCIITAQVVFCGGSSVGNNCWIGVGSIVKEKVKIGNGVMVGLGSVVTRDIPDNQTWMGAPAMPAEEFKQQQKNIKSIRDHGR